MNQSLISEECSAFSMKCCTGLCPTPTLDYLPPLSPTLPPLYPAATKALFQHRTLSISQTAAIVTWKCKFMMWFFDLLELIATQVAGEGGSTNRQECYQTRAQQRQFITNQQCFICKLPVSAFPVLGRFDLLRFLLLVFQCEIFLRDHIYVLEIRIRASADGTSCMYVLHPSTCLGMFD